MSIPTSLSIRAVTPSFQEHTGTQTTGAPVAAALVQLTGATASTILKLTGTHASWFQLKAYSASLYMLELRPGVKLDFETAPQLSVSVVATSASVSGSRTATHTLQITDVNEAPSQVKLNTTISSLAENTSTATRTKVADVVITDDALGSNLITLSGADAGSFEVLGSGLYLKAGVVLDFEVQSRFDVTVSVKDNNLPASLPVAVKFTLNVTDVPEGPLMFTPKAGTAYGSSDASTALVLPQHFMLVGDDEANVLRVYSRSGGVAVAEFFYGDYLGIGTTELDLEASTQIGSTQYWIGSHGNSKAGVDAPHREWIFSTTTTGTGAATQLTFTGRYNGLEAALSAWDSSNAHGLGAHRFGIAAGTASGTPERNVGFGVEGLTSSPSGDALWISLRAPVTGGADLNKALIVPLLNVNAVLAGQAQPQFGPAIELNLGGRGIRSIEKNAQGSYLIIAGPTGPASADVADDFRLYTWGGQFDSQGQATGLVHRSADLDALLPAGASFETMVQTPSSLVDGTRVQLLQDDGAVVLNGTASKDLPPAQQSFSGNWVTLGAPVLDTTAPSLVRSAPSDNAVDVALDGTVVLTFNEPVRAGVGAFVLKVGATVVASLDVRSAAVSFEYNTVTLKPTASLTKNTAYTLEFASGVVLDAAGTAHAGLTGAAALDFRTIDVPTIQGTILQPGDVFFLAINTDTTDLFAFSFVRDIAAGTRISFTDRDYSSTAGFSSSGEGVYVWTADIAYAAGTIVTLQPDSAPGFNPIASHGSVVGAGGGLSATAETLYAFQGADSGSMTGGVTGLAAGAGGAITVTTFLASLNAGGAAAGSIPASISPYAQAFTTDDAVYRGELRGLTPTEFASAARDANNWFTSDTVVSTVGSGGRLVFPNHAPSGRDASLSTDEDTARVLAAADFGFADSASDDGVNVPIGMLQSVKIITLPGAGLLMLKGTAVSAGQSVSAADLSSGQLTFVPAAQASGSAYASLTFQVQDNGGTTRGGVDLDPSPNTLTLDVVPVNDAPVAVADTASTTPGTAVVINVLANDTDADNVSPVPANAGLSIKAGSLTVDAAQGSAVIQGGQVRFTPAAGFEGVAQIGYTVTDGQAESLGQVVVNVAPTLTLISTIQGTGETSPLSGQTVTVQGRVTAWKPGLNLFFVQEEAADQDGNPLTSEGIAVFYGSANPGIGEGSLGDVVRFSATVTEFKATSDTGSGTLTELINISGFRVITDGTAADLPAPVSVTLPIASGTTLERYEGMLIQVSAASGKPLFVSDTYTFARFGEVTLHADAVPQTYTEFNTPSVSGYAAYQDFLRRNSLQLEDGSSAQNPSLAALSSGSQITRDTTDDGVANGTAIGVQADASVSFIRVGDSTASVTGVLGYGFGSYELQPTQTVALHAAPRPVGAPDVGAAEVKVASFNVLNYFTTLGSATFTNPSGTVHQGRGADTSAEFAQQQAKIVAAMMATGAHVFGLNELQNNGEGASSAIASLVNALNAAAGSNRFNYIKGHATGDDAIRVGVIYDTNVVVPVGSAATPNTGTYSIFASSNRLPVAQSFAYLGDASKSFTLVVNHFKSKGSAAGLVGDADQGDGQGNSAATRLEASKQLVAWLSTNPTGSSSDNIVLTGDLNAYSQEDPVTYLATTGGFTEATKPGDYSYIFDGLRGSLDHVMTRGLDAGEVTGVAHFNINSDEQIAMDYNDEFGDGSVTRDLDRNDHYRASDHDPVVIGLKIKAGSPPASADVTPPAAPSVALASASDTGDTSSDKLSSVATPQVVVTLNGTGSSAPVTGDTIKVYAASTLVASSTLTAADLAAGSLTLTTLPLGADGAKSLTATVTDAAGNASAASPALSYTLDTTAPVLQSAATSADGLTITLSYNQALSSLQAPATAAFSVKVGGVVVALAANNAVAVSGSTLTLTLAAAVKSGETVTVSYADPTSADDAQAVQDPAGNDAVSLVDRAVTNTVAGAATPTALSAGSIAFVGFNADGTDGYAFVAIDPIPAGQVIYFRDDEWNGTAWRDGNEGLVTWTNNTGTVLPAGTLIEILNLNNAAIGANTGTASNVRSSRQSLANSDETVYAFTAESNSAAGGLSGTFTFLTAVANSGFDTEGRGLLTNTGLSAGVNALNLGALSGSPDVAVYKLGSQNFASRNAALSSFNTPSNWVTQDASGDQHADSITPDIPFLSSNFSPMKNAVIVIGVSAMP